MAILDLLKECNFFAKVKLGFFRYATIALLTAATQQAITAITFRCPCVHYNETTSDCRLVILGLENAQCVQPLNFYYGLSFVYGPAVALFVLGLVIQSTLWEIITGWCYRTEQYQGSCKTFMKNTKKILGCALLSPLTWIVVALIDGRHVACAFTPLPYDAGDTLSTYADCFEVSETARPSMSPGYNRQRAYFQFLGWTVIGLLFLIGLLCLCVAKCKHPLTYYHSKYHAVYQMKEKDLFKAKLQNKACERATANIEKFFDRARSKEEWDVIASGVKIQRLDEHNIVSTAVQKWAEDDSEKCVQLQSTSA